MTIARPTDARELAQALADAAAQGGPIALGGAFSKPHFGGAPPKAAVTVSAAAMTRVLQYEPKDLTISVEAGLPYRDLQALLVRNHQMVPLDPPYADAGTVGGVVSANLSGPRRRAFGTARDLIIGMEFATLEGKLVRTGGMVVKNVAGLDMAKLLVGAQGTLAAIASVNFKLTPTPTATRTFALSSPTLAEAMEKRARVAQGRLTPLALDLLTSAAAARVGLSGFVLLLQAGGSEEVLARNARELPEATAVDGPAEAALWEAVREFTPRYLTEHADGLSVRVSSSPGEMAKVMESCPGPVVARASLGVLYAHFRSTGEAAGWLTAATARGWRPVVEFGSAEAKRGLTLWPVTGSDFAMMEKIKDMFDPGRLLNPGRLFGRL